MTHTIPHYIKSNAKNYPKDIALREKKFGVWKTKDWQQCLEEIENITLGLYAKGITEKTKLTINFMKLKMREYDELSKELEKLKSK